MAENYKLLYEQMKKIVTTYQDEVVPCLREIIKDLEQNQIKVRCKDCKHYQQYHKGRTEELCEWGKCKLISMDIDMPSNGFCCFGERRTNEPEEPV